MTSAGLPEVSKCGLTCLTATHSPLAQVSHLCSSPTGGWRLVETSAHLGEVQATLRSHAHRGRGNVTAQLPGLVHATQAVGVAALSGGRQS